MARLVLVPCVGCGAPLELDADGPASVRCAYCGTVHSPPATPTATVAAERARGSAPHPLLVIGSLLGGIALVIGGGLTVEECANRSDADKVVHLSEIEGLPAYPHYGAHRLLMLPDGTLWVACKHDALCVLDEHGRGLGRVELPPADPDSPDPGLRGATRGLAPTHSGSVLVLHRGALLEVDAAGRRVKGKREPLAAGETARCLARGHDGGLWVGTSDDDLVALGRDFSVTARWEDPLLAFDRRHHGCDTLAVDAAGNVWVTPEEAPALYVFAPDGRLLRRHAPGGPGTYQGLAVLGDGSVVTGYYMQLFRLGTSFEELPGPKARRDRWAEVTDVVLARDGSLLVGTALGYLAWWRRPEERW